MLFQHLLPEISLQGCKPEPVPRIMPDHKLYRPAAKIANTIE
jgi:hypothetical protein